MRLPARSTAERLLIVPRAHTAVLDTRFQLEMYALFHRSFGARLGHLVGSPMILLGVFTGLHALTGGIWAGMAVLAVIVALGLRIDTIAAGITAGLGLALLALAIRLADPVAGSAMLACVVLVGVGAAIQTLSHAFEDVPPPHSGSSRFVPVREWIPRIDLRELLRSTALTFGVFIWLELWATPRIWTIQVLSLLMAAGHRPKLREALRQRTREILDDPTSDWRRPRRASA